jgi:hypothetical protein
MGCNNNRCGISGYPASATNYDACRAPYYCQGLLIMYNNKLYVVSKSYPTGVPAAAPIISRWREVARRRRCTTRPSRLPTLKAKPYHITE